MRIIYGVCSWGLGHATRSLPVIRKLLEEGDLLTVISHGRALYLIRRELGDQVEYIDIPDYPVLVAENRRLFMVKTLLSPPLFIRNMYIGVEKLRRILRRKKADLIVSDGRYDMYSRVIPSFFISHQIRIKNPFNLRVLERYSEYLNLFLFKRFKGVIVPDYRDNGFSGDLSHNLDKIEEDKLHYVGILSDFKKKDLPKTIDYLISITGPEPQRSLLEDKVLSQISYLKGNIVLTSGRTEDTEEQVEGRIKIYSYLSKEEREELLNKTRMVITRSGYSTIMDLAVIGLKALMIPTPGQVEQEYLAWYHHRLGNCYSVEQENLDLRRDVEAAEETKGFSCNNSVEEAVEKILEILYS